MRNLIIVLFIAFQPLTAAEFHANLDETKIPPSEVPALLRLADGTTVSDAAG